MDLDEKPDDSLLTRFELIVTASAALAEKFAPDVAQSIEETTGKSSSFLGGIFGKKKLLNKCRFAVLSLTVHEVIKSSNVFSPTDPEGFQERYVGEIIRAWVPAVLQRKFFEATNDNIRDYQDYLMGNIDHGVYLMKITGRLLDSRDPLVFMGLVTWVPGIVAGVESIKETLGHSHDDDQLKKKKKEKRRRAGAVNADSPRKKERKGKP